jgi:CheY-like chemotaxis protein
MSGFEAIDKIKSGKVYDIVFMDHMMPKMDGIEATKILRDMGYTHSVVALTANAVAGQADIFLGNGFDDFISKPIDVRQLNVVLNKLIRDKKPPEVVEAARKQAENKKEQPAEPAISARFAEVFSRDASKSIVALEAINGKTGQYDDHDIRTYIIHVHGMKSALGNIGKMSLSAVAMKLETMARDGNIEGIKANTTAFLDSLKALVEELAPKPKVEAIPETNAGIAADTAQGGGLGLADCREKLLAIKASCEDYDEKTADDIISELKQKPLAQSIIDLLSSVTDHLLHSDFDEAAEAIQKFTEK